MDINKDKKIIVKLQWLSGLIAVGLFAYFVKRITVHDYKAALLDILCAIYMLYLAFHMKDHPSYK